MARKSGFVRRNGVMRRETLWAGQSPADTVVGTSSAVLISVFNAALLALRPFTIVRTRGRIGVFLDQFAEPESYGVGYGIAVVSEQATAIGVTAVPTPITDLTSDLFYVYENLAGRLEANSASETTEAGVWKDFDSKAMRKVNGDQDIAVVVEANGAIGQIFFDTFRFLIKLH